MRQSGNISRVPDRWIAPLPHIAGADDPELQSMGLFVPDSIQRYWRTHTPQLAYNAAILPASIDWSGYDSPVKAQGRCGACWAFAAVAAVENAGLQDDLSEQVLISCAGAGNCSGGYYEDALHYVHNSGLPPESTYPYSETNGDCASKGAGPALLERISSMTTSLWGDVARLDDLKGALQNGPVVVRMLVFADFNAYTGGIYHHTTGSFKGYHAVLVVGYNDDERCFKAKNSWGTGWGEGGYFRISYSDLSNDVEFGGYGAQVLGVHTEYPTTLTVNENPLPEGYALEQNYPNPFNPVTIIQYTVGGTGVEGRGNGEEAEAGGSGLGAGVVRLVVYDLLGREAATLVNERKAPGIYEARFDGSGLPSGIYYYRLTVEGDAQSRSMVLLK